MEKLEISITSNGTHVDLEIFDPRFADAGLRDFYPLTWYDFDNYADAVRHLESFAAGFETYDRLADKFATLAVAPSASADRAETALQNHLWSL